VKILLSNSSPDPLYDQIVRQIRAQIISGDLGESSPLPSIRKLAHDLQISVITTKRAYEELEKEGLIDTVGGKGTFVAAQNPGFLREKRLKVVEEKLAEAVSEARLLGIDLEALGEMLGLLWEQDQQSTARAAAPSRSPAPSHR
jgi:GntR family transcriptional regulator